MLQRLDILLQESIKRVEYKIISCYEYCWTCISCTGLKHETFVSYNPNESRGFTHDQQLYFHPNARSTPRFELVDTSIRYQNVARSKAKIQSVLSCLLYCGLWRKWSPHQIMVLWRRKLKKKFITTRVPKVRTAYRKHENHAIRWHPTSLRRSRLRSCRPKV